ncbi:MAG: hypothetical protein R3F59_32730 [Myxococcota bacterium]
MRDPNQPEDSGSFLAPALLTGTSAEFMGRKPLPRVLRERRVIFVLGPKGVGKSSVARALMPGDRLELERSQIEHAMLERVRDARWAEALLAARALLLDGPVWLRNRRGAVTLLLELGRVRANAGRRTVFCQVETDGSIEELISLTEPGSAAVVGLRFPTGRTSRLRCAREMCDLHGLPHGVADGSEALDPWRYDRLEAFLVERAWRTP